MTGFLQRSFIPLVTVALGLLLNVAGIVSYILAGEGASITALIPAFAGGLFLILGGLAFKSSLRKTVIHIALGLALILALYCSYKVPVLLSESAAVDSVPSGDVRKMFAFLTTALACIAYVVLGVRSFMEARQARRDADRAERRAEAARV